MKHTAQLLKKTLDQSGPFLIVSHENPDGDAIGSALSLYILLQQMGKQVTVWLPGRFPAYYRWLPFADKIQYFSEKQELFAEALQEATILIGVDLSSLSRTGKMHSSLTEFSGTRILIDHHVGPATQEFDLVFSDVTVSSTSELIYHLLAMTDKEDMVNLPMAEALYVGIMTDTGSFSFNCNSSNTYEVVGKLINKGILADRIHKLVYDNNTESRIRLLGYALHKMKVLQKFKTAYISLDKEELAASRSQVGDTEGIVNFALSIKGIMLAAFFSIRDGEVKISFRSKGGFSVNDFARNHFNGGGHYNAAGGSFKGTIEEAVLHFESLLPGYQSELARYEKLF